MSKINPYDTLDEQPSDYLSDTKPPLPKEYKSQKNKDVISDPYFKMWRNDSDDHWYISSKFESALIILKDRDKQRVIDKYNSRVLNIEYEEPDNE